ncbi:MAG: signal peptidase II [Lachnospiraceae bacterium]|nr:signal peptidase II [Lachnospiraceae bacterium]
MNKKKIRYLGCTGAGILALLLADQYTKYLAQEYLKDQADIIWIPQVFQLHYLENRGAAFGLLQNQKFIFLALCALFLCAAFLFLLQMPATSRYIPLYFIAAGLSAGAAGNGIDRILYGYVIDFFYFSLIDFPVFNMADIYVTVSGFLLILYVCFVYREEDFAFMQRRKS